jgi:hypothetical protein
VRPNIEIRNARDFLADFFQGRPYPSEKERVVTAQGPARLFGNFDLGGCEKTAPENSRKFPIFGE